MDKYGNPAHHTGHLGAPGTTGAFETYDPLGAPGTTGASPTTTAGYNTSGGQDQLHRPPPAAAAGHQVPLNTTGTTDHGYAYGTAATTGHEDHASLNAKTGGYEGLHSGGYDTLSKGAGGHGGDKGHVGDQGVGAGAGGYEAGTDWGQIQHGGGYDTGGKKDRQGKGVKEHSGSGYDDDTGGDWTQSEDSVTGVTATVVEVVTEEPLQDEESKGFVDRIMEHLPGTGGGRTK